MGSAAEMQIRWCLIKALPVKYQKASANAGAFFVLKHRQYNGVGYTNLRAYSLMTLPDPIILLTTLAAPVKRTFPLP